MLLIGLREEDKDMTHIVYEVFPVTLRNKQPVLIQHHEQERQPWMLPHQPNRHPNEVIIQHLLAIFGMLVDMQRTIVHSTSWRYDAACDQILLTYLVVLPHDAWLETQYIAFEPIKATNIRHGQHHLPPEQLAPSEVLAHALDHLAALSSYDPAIQRVLEPAWEAILHTRRPQPAGCLQRASQSNHLKEADWQPLPSPLQLVMLPECDEMLATKTLASTQISS